MLRDVLCDDVSQARFLRVLCIQMSYRILEPSIASVFGSAACYRARQGHGRVFAAATKGEALDQQLRHPDQWYYYVYYSCTDTVSLYTCTY